MVLEWQCLHYVYEQNVLLMKQREAFLQMKCSHFLIKHFRYDIVFGHVECVSQYDYPFMLVFLKIFPILYHMLFFHIRYA